MLSSPALDGSRESPSVVEHESAGPDSGSTKKVRRSGLLSIFTIPFTDPPVGIQTTLCIEEGGCVLDWLACRRSSSPLSHSRRLAPTATWSEGRPLGQRCDQEEICLVFPCYGGGSATGSGQARAGNMGRVASCAQDRKWITSLAAIVAPHTCDCGKGRVGASNTGASRYVTLFVSCDRLCRGNDPTCIS